MPDLILSAGLARCGTGALAAALRATPGIGLPGGPRRRAAAFWEQDAAEYAGRLRVAASGAASGGGPGVIFDSAPGSLHGGPARFAQALDLLATLQAQGIRPVLLVQVRGLLARAFSHYWHDIAQHHAQFGRLWSVRTAGDPARLAAPYQRSFAEEMADPAGDAKFLPPLGEMLTAAVRRLGAGQVRLLHGDQPDAALQALLAGLRPETPGPVPPCAPLAEVLAPVYLLPEADPGAAPQPARACVLVLHDSCERLLGTDYNLAAITAAAARWTRDLTPGMLPPRVLDYLAAQQALIAALPAECFLAGQRGRIVADLAVVPARLAATGVTPPAEAVRALLAQALPESPQPVVTQPAVTRPETEGRAGAEGDGKVMVGRQNRLFLHNDMNRVLAQHSGALRLSDAETAQWRKVLADRHAGCRARGLPYAMVFAPDTHSVYREDIPELDGVPAHRRPILQVLAACLGGDGLPDPDLPVPHYPLEPLRAARAQGEVCHVTDSHWSAFGAHVACRAVLTRMNLGVPILGDGDVVLTDRETVGDLGVKFDPPRAGRTTEVAVRARHSAKVWNNGVTNRGHMSFWKGSRRDLPRCLLLTDSYGWRFQTFLAQSFSDLFIVHSPQFEPEAIDRFGPDVVISLLAERFAYKVPQDAGGKSALEQAREKNPAVDWPDFAAL